MVFLLILTKVKRKILIASFLKPVNDIRSYEKMAKSLARNHSYELYCLGYPSNIELSGTNIQLISLSSFKKSGVHRILARWKVFKIYVKLKPELIIVNSPDLLLLTVLYKILFGGKIIYDIRENYFYNLSYQNNYKWGVKHILAILVRAKERIASPLFDHYFLAEKIYAEQLKFIKDNYTVLENKSLLPDKVKTLDQIKSNFKFIISGTIAIEYGIIEGIEFFNKMQQNQPKSTLTIIGHCPNNSLYIELKSLYENNILINLKISKNPILHSEIEEQILRADIGLLPYLPNKSTQGKWPTKLYEYMAYNLPFIIQENSVWDEYIKSKSSCLLFNFADQTKDSIQPIIESIRSMEFYNAPHQPDIYWSSEETKLLKRVEKVLSVI